MDNKGNVNGMIVSIFGVLFLISAVVIFIIFMTSSLSIQAIEMEPDMINSSYKNQYNLSTNISINMLNFMSFMPYLLFIAAMFLVIGLMIIIGRKKY